MCTPESFPCYPSREERDAWIEGIFAEAETLTVQAEVLDRRNFLYAMGAPNVRNCSYVRMTVSNGHVFYCYWDWVPGAPAPLLVHTPGYRSEISVHHMLKMEGYNVLHVDPMGYLTPNGPNPEYGAPGLWPVLGDTVHSGGSRGYRDFFLYTVLAVRWACAQPSVQADRVSFYGTSQGGMASLVLGSMYVGRGARCVCADLPYLQAQYLRESEDMGEGRRALCMIDGVNHADRLSALPVLLTSGGADELCPGPTIRAVFDRLHGTRCYMEIAEEPHRYTQEFLYLIPGWFRMYA